MTTTYHAEEPDLLAEAERNQACLRLREWLVSCGERRGDGLWEEYFYLPDEGVAVAFVDQLRDQLRGCAMARWVGIRRFENQVHVWIIAACQGRHPDAVEPDWPQTPA